ncbi:C-C chemokine receptor type 7 [Ambystoma mexicanum]|uniref:C-C chemokine receptor type 7 n=1 Tax=Ambystoma mexicanum TaxID=8296 RepID=UPI0037E9625E
MEQGNGPAPGVTVVLAALSFQLCNANVNSTDFIYGYEDDINATAVDYSNYQFPCQKTDVREFRAVFLPVIYAVICFVGLTGNGLVMLTYVYFKRLKTMTDLYLLNLALADILFLLTLPFWAVGASTDWVFGDFFCKMVYCVFKMSFFSGMFLLMGISIDRYFCIVQATSAHRHRPRTAYIGKLSCVVIWIVAFILAMPEVAHSGQKMANNKMHCTIISNNIVSYKGGIKVTQIIVGFLVPLMVMSFCYFMIIKTLLQARNFERYKAIKVIMAVVIVFVLFQLPHNSILLAKTISNSTVDCEKSKQLDIADDVTYSLACFRCCLNPFLYAFIGVKFRNDLFKLLKELGCLSQDQLLQWSTCRQHRRMSVAMETETTTTFSP